MLNKNYSLDKLTQTKIDDYIHLYLECDTNEGKLVGICEGISIGQRKECSFTAEAVYYLLLLKVDLFNLIGQGLVIEK